MNNSDSHGFPCIHDLRLAIEAMIANPPTRRTILVPRGPDRLDEERVHARGTTTEGSRGGAAQGD